MGSGYALYNHRFARFSARPAAAATAETVHLVTGSMSVILTAIFFAFIVAAKAQESVEDVPLPAWTEPTLPTSEPAPATEAAPEPLPSKPPELLPSSSAPLPPSEEAFPSASDPWS